MVRTTINIARHKFGKFLMWVAMAFALYYFVFLFVTEIGKPEVPQSKYENTERLKAAPDTYRIDNSFLQRNKFGLWELYLEGSPYDMGLVSGKLTRELIEVQEEAFVEQIGTLIPSDYYLRFLRHGIAWFNRDIDDNIPLEYQQEIYGISKSCSDEFNFIAMPYQRMLNYHAAHDIGHALQDLALVGCTSFGANLDQENDNMIIGRNLDFYINEKFAENKIVAFVNPEQGYKFMYITWASMIGVVSGMNEEGLTVTLNAAKSDVPFKSATPISILAREILQYASNIEEAKAIAEKMEIFVSEQLLIGSANDNTAVVIEKSPAKTGVYKSKMDFLVSANHFQSETFADDENNLEFMQESSSVYREKRCSQLIEDADSIGVKTAVNILRDKKGIGGKDIGIGNEKAMCQMISHHGVVFLPEQLKVWVSTSPYQLGSFVCYDLKEVFDTKAIVFDSLLTIAPDAFLSNGDWEEYQKYKEDYEIIKSAVKAEIPLTGARELLAEFIDLNPEYYQTYLLAADYCSMAGNKEKTIEMLKKALNCEFENTLTKKHTEEKLKELTE